MRWVLCLPRTIFTMPINWFRLLLIFSCNLRVPLKISLVKIRKFISNHSILIQINILRVGSFVMTKLRNCMIIDYNKYILILHGSKYAQDN
jgi:hypothetical protein